MAKTLKYTGAPGLTVEALIFNSLGQVYNRIDDEMQLFAAVDYAEYTCAVPELDTGLGVYFGDHPNAGTFYLTGGQFLVVYKDASGGSAVNNPVLRSEYRELLVDTEDFSWSGLMGTTFGSTAYGILRNFLSSMAEFGTFGPLPLSGIVVGVDGISATLFGNVEGTVGGVTGDVGGNVVGSVGSVAGNVGGNVIGGVIGNVSGNVAGNVLGNVNGSVAAVTTVTNVTGFNGFVLINGTTAINSGTTTSFTFNLTSTALAVFRALIIASGLNELVAQRKIRVRVSAVGGTVHWRTITSYTDSGGSTPNLVFTWTDPIAGAATGSPVITYENNVAALESKRPFTIG